ncbi:hypothetical protein FKM82_003805 [Ascaphus truei]
MLLSGMLGDSALHGVLPYFFHPLDGIFVIHFSLLFPTGNWSGNARMCKFMICGHLTYLLDRPFKSNMIYSSTCCLVFEGVKLMYMTILRQ